MRFLLIDIGDFIHGGNQLKRERLLGRCSVFGLLTNNPSEKNKLNYNCNNFKGE
jgi:hypothetical protein